MEVVDEMVRAMRHMADDLSSGNLSKDEITEEVFNGYLDTKELPDPDLMIAQAGKKDCQTYVMAVSIYRILFYRDSVAGFYKKGIRKGKLRSIIKETEDTAV